MHKDAEALRKSQCRPGLLSPWLVLMV